MKVPLRDSIQNESQVRHIHVDKSEYLNGIISKIPQRNSKIIFVLGSYESLERLEGLIKSG